MCEVPNAVRYDALKLSMFYHGADDWPALVGRAAEVRHIVGPVVRLFEEVMDKEDIPQMQIKLGLDYSLEMETILTTTRGYNKLPKHEATKFKVAALNFVACASAIRAHFQGLGIKIFGFTVKMHYLLHLADHAEHFHPHLGWCYSGEDFLQKVKKLARSCCNAVSFDQVVIRLLQKYVFGIFHKLSTEINWRWRRS